MPRYRRPAALAVEEAEGGQAAELPARPPRPVRTDPEAVGEGGNLAELRQQRPQAPQRRSAAARDLAVAGPPLQWAGLHHRPGVGVVGKPLHAPGRRTRGATTSIRPSSSSATLAIRATVPTSTRWSPPPTSDPRVISTTPNSPVRLRGSRAIRVAVALLEHVEGQAASGNSTVDNGNIPRAGGHLDRWVGARPAAAARRRPGRLPRRRSTTAIGHRRPPPTPG